MLRAFLNAPLAPEEDRLTPEQKAEFDNAVAFMKAHPECSFSSDEIAVALIQRQAAEGGTGDAETVEIHRDLVQRAKRLCLAEGVSLSAMAAKISAKSAAAQAAWEAWATERGLPLKMSVED